MAGWVAAVGLWGMAYLLGSLPTGYLAGYLLQGIDIRTQGSGSTGATNVLRTLGRGPAIAVLLIDVLKGVAAIYLIPWFTQPAVQAFLNTRGWVADPTQVFPLSGLVVGAGLAVLLGHSRSIWLGFTGGKSVATGLGVLLALAWPVGLAALGVFSLCLAISRIVSLSSMMAAIAVPLLMVGTQQPLAYQWFGLAAGIYVIWRHRSNIERLLAGREPRVGQKLDVSSPPAPALTQQQGSNTSDAETLREQG
ncbi:glycerol-3-phosphate 1-O-acyltransferase PlsY [Trichothermofontia sp.]